MIDDYKQERILEIIKDCEEIQHSHESQYTKESSKIIAYEEIAELMEGEL